MIGLTAKEAIRLREKAPAMRARMKQIVREEKALRREREQLREDLYVGDSVRLHKGKPYWAPYGPDSIYSLDNKRHAVIRQRVDELWNVELEKEKYRDGYLCNVKSLIAVPKAHARKVALAWVIKGELP